MEWLKKNTLPLNEKMCKKIIFLVRGGRLEGDKIHVATGFWNVWSEKEFIDMPLYKYDACVLADDGLYYYGRLMGCAGFDKVIAWMSEEDLANTYKD